MSSSHAVTGVIECPCCKKAFKSKRYLKCHLAYPVNRRCNAVYLGLHGVDDQTTGRKRFFEDNDYSTEGNIEGVRKDVSYESSEGGVEMSESNTQFATCRGGDSNGSFSGMQEVDDSVNEEEDDSLKEDNGFSFFDDKWNKEVDHGSGNTQSTSILEDDFPSTTIMDDFEKYIMYSQTHTCHLTPDDCAGIELLDILIKQRAPLRVFDDIYKWHTSNMEATSTVLKDSLLKMLEARYEMDKQRPKVLKNLILPHSRAEVDLVYHDFANQVKSLLIDPRIGDDDYLFFDDDPFSAPPDVTLTVSDINTGSAYKETYKKLITKPGKQVLLPIIMYIDAAVTGQYDHLPIEALMFTLGIFNATTRDKDYAWRSLGYVTKFLPEETQAKNILLQGGGVDVQDYLSDESSEGPCLGVVSEDLQRSSESEDDSLSEVDNDDDNLEPTKKVPSCSAQDLHAMLDTLLSSYRECEQRGFMWKLSYKGNVYAVEFVPFIMFVKGDTQEHDKHCGKYTSRGKNVQNLCRYCCVPNEETDDPKASKYPRKSPLMIQDLVNAGDIDGLKAISQQYFNNCWYKVRFGQHNDYGIHGACPIEVLHWLQIGKFTYLRDMFFDQLGKTSDLSNKFNGIARALGKVFKRQSDRDIPRLNFTKGIRRGKLMAHEMSGMMIVLVACLRCAKGRSLLLNETRGRSKVNFGTPNLIDDWILLLESLLQWEAWMKEPEMSVFDVLRARMKIPEIMEMEKYVGKRTEGMQFKIFKFHASLHLPDDILAFGVPSHVNTQSDESHHKKSKTAAIHTQRRMKSFCMQTARNLHAMDVVDIGMQEIHGGRVPWDYYYQDEKEVEDMDTHSLEDSSDDDVEVVNTGTSVKFFYSRQSGGYSYTINSQMKDKWKFKLDKQLIMFIGKVFDLISIDESLTDITLFTEHKRNGVIFRGTPFLYDRPWRDWVIIDWGKAGKLPAQIHIFVNLDNVPEDSAYSPGIYAVVESAKPNATSQERKIRSDLFKPFLKEHKGISKNGDITRKYHLVDTNSFYAPAILIPDIGNANKAAYLQLLPRSQWKDSFIQWLRDDEMDDRQNE